MMTRRHALKTAIFTAAGISTSLSLTRLFAQAPPAMPLPPPLSGPFRLPPLPYPVDALEPHIDAQTMQIHHDKHHAGYILNLNRAIADQPELQKRSPEEIVRNLSAVPEKIRAAARNYGGGHVNHTLFWQMLKKNNGGKPVGGLAKAIDKHFQSFAGFQEQFTKAATTLFGSGWTWLTIGPSKELRIETTANQDSPISANRTPLLGIDVWEHAYYLRYQNRRPDYVAAFYNVINWDFVGERYQKALR